MTSEKQKVPRYCKMAENKKPGRKTAGFLWHCDPIRVESPTK